MNYNQLITLLSLNVGCAEERVRSYTETLVKWMSEEIADQQQLLVSGFGKFFLDLNHEYVYADEKGKRFLMPPCLTLRFTPIALVEDVAVGEGKVFPTIAETLVSQQNAEPHIAEHFAVSFFKCILDVMDRGEAVEVDGLGTFLLSKVSLDNSVYGKVSFTPAETLAARVNRPFSYFPSVELNEGVSFDDVRVVSAHDKSYETQADSQVFLISAEHIDTAEAGQSGNAETLETEEVEEQKDTSQPTKEEEPSDSPVEPETADPGEVVASKKEDEPPTPASEEQSPAMPVEELPAAEDIHGKRPVMRWAAWALVGCLLLAGLYFLLANRGDHDGAVVQAEVEVADTLSADTLSRHPDEGFETVTDVSANKENLDFAAMNAQIPYGAYDIVGIDTTITVMPGQDLPTIARVFLGTDILIYLIVANDGNNNPQEGDKYRIPRLEKR